MVPRRARRASVPLLILLLTTLAACGGAGEPEAVSTGSAGRQRQDAVTTTTPATTAPATTTPTTSAPTTTAPTTTVIAPAAGDDPSPVAGVTASELAAAVAAPVGGATRSLVGPVLDRVPVGSSAGWRVRVPSDAPVRAARVEVLVGGRSIGQAVPSPDLEALVAVTLDGTGLVAGATVQLRWEGGEPIAAGRLAVAR